MRLPALLFAAIFLLSQQSYAQNFSRKPCKLNISAPQEGLVVGEKLSYSVEWLGIPVLNVSLETKEIKEVSGRQCYHVEATASPNKFFKIFYNVEHKVASYIDAQTLLPLRFEKSRCEKGTCTNILIEFDRKNNEARFVSEKTHSVKIAPNTQDLLSILYYFRDLDVTAGGSYSANIIYDRKGWPISVNVKDAYLKDIRKKGTFSVIEISPDSDLIVNLIGKRKVTATFTSDPRRIPLLFTLNTRLGILRGAIKKIPD